MGNSFKKDYFFVYCIYCNNKCSELQNVVCLDCGNIFVPNKLDPDTTFTLKNIKKKIEFLERMCIYNRTRTEHALHYLDSLILHNNITFKTPIDMEIKRPSLNCPSTWNRHMKIIYILYLIEKYNYFRSYNYIIYEAVLSRKLMSNMKQNFNTVGTEDPPPSYYQISDLV